jgi:fucose permease
MLQLSRKVVLFFLRYLVDYLHRLNADRADSQQQIYHLLFVVGEFVGVVLLADGEAFRR